MSIENSHHLEKNQWQNSSIYDCSSTSHKQSSQRQNDNLPDTKYSPQSSKKHEDSKKNLRLEQWSLSEVQKLFSIYGDYGPQWKIIETQLPQKSANSIKNRFYSVLRAFLKNLFLCHPELKNKLFPQISSKIILRFFEGRKEFYRLKGFGKKILRLINYDIQSEKLASIAQKKLKLIIRIYQIIYQKHKIFTQNLPKTPAIKSSQQNQKSEPRQRKTETKTETKAETKAENIPKEEPANLPFLYPYNQNYLILPIESTTYESIPAQPFVLLNYNFFYGI